MHVVDIKKDITNKDLCLQIKLSAEPDRQPSVHNELYIKQVQRKYSSFMEEREINFDFRDQEVCMYAKQIALVLGLEEEVEFE